MVQGFTGLGVQGFRDPMSASESSGREDSQGFEGFGA